MHFSHTLYSNSGGYIVQDTSAKPQSLSVDEFFRRKITLLADSNNGGVIYVGTIATSQQYPLAKGQMLEIEDSTLSSIWVHGSTIGDILHWICGGSSEAILEAHETQKRLAVERAKGKGLKND